MLAAYAQRLGPLEALESVRRVNETAIASGNVRKEDGREQMRAWERESPAGTSMHRQEPSVQIAAAAALGFDVVKDGS